MTDYERGVEQASSVYKEVIRKYVNIDQDQVHVALEDQGSCSILELNITLPDR